MASYIYIYIYILSKLATYFICLVRKDDDSRAQIRREICDINRWMAFVAIRALSYWSCSFDINVLVVHTHSIAHGTLPIAYSHLHSISNRYCFAALTICIIHLLSPSPARDTTRRLPSKAIRISAAHTYETYVENFVHNKRAKRAALTTWLELFAKLNSHNNIFMTVKHREQSSSLLSCQLNSSR